MKNEFKQTYEYWRDNILRLTLVIGGLFIVLCALMAILFYKNPNEGQLIIQSFAQDKEDIIASDGSISVVKLFLNNIFASAMAIGIGIIPFIFLPAITVVANATVVGALLGFMKATTQIQIWKTILFGLLPHGIFELPALFISMAMGIYLCKTVSVRLIVKDKSKTEKILGALNQLTRVFVLIVIPLLLLAALVEAYITPMIMTLGNIS